MTEEWEQYRIDQAEAWLMKVRKLVRYAGSLEKSARQQIEAADGLKAIDYSRVQVSMSPVKDALETSYIERMELHDALSVLASEARAKVTEAAVRVSRMPDSTEATCLQLYYVDATETWERVCVAMNYSWDGMMKLRRRALLHAFDVMPHGERDPMPPAL